jgi:hypothetical protein
MASRLPRIRGALGKSEIFFAKRTQPAGVVPQPYWKGCKGWQYTFC